jgi:hypothetical protein
MTTITFDTFKFVDRLEKAGMTREQAAAIVEAQKDAFSNVIENGVATKSDLMAVKSELKADIAKLENRLDGMHSEMKSMELRLIIKLGAFMAASVATTVALVKLL